jgi:hypothetical protein
MEEGREMSCHAGETAFVLAGQAFLLGAKAACRWKRRTLCVLREESLGYEKSTDGGVCDLSV